MANEFYYKRKQQGLCAKCGKENDRKPKVNCSICSDKDKQFRWKLIARNMCSECAKNPIDSRHSTYKCTECRKKRNSKQVTDKRRTQVSHWRTILKEQAVEKLGGYCVECGESLSQLLHIDHIDNNGKEHRNLVKGSYGVLREIISGKCSYRVQLLCANCHSLKGAYRRSLYKNYHDSPGAKTVEKVWGVELWLHNSKNYCAKRLLLNPGFQCSLHRHLLKRETFAIIRGIVYLQLGDEVRKMIPGEFVTIEPGTYHRFWTFTPTGAEIFETSTQHFDEDSYRIEPSGPKGTQEMSK